MISATALTLALAATVSAKVQFGGINISGCDFDCDTSGACNGGKVCPTTAGPTQMQHFVNDDGFNLFRLPVGWQYLVNYSLGGALDENFMTSEYDPIVNACVATGASCIIDVHNYARWYNGIIGQGGPSNEQFADLWQKLAGRYASHGTQIIFGVMNEPHDLDINVWVNTVQAAVNAIRGATGNNDNIILVPGTVYSSAGAFVDQSTAVAAVSNPDGSKNNLIFDVHQYLDANFSGTETECTSSNIDGFQGLANYLRSNGRQALLSETGGGNTDSCVQYMCAALDFLNSNSDVFLGFTSWAAGSFDSTYNLTETPQNGQDTRLVAECFKPKFAS